MPHGSGLVLLGLPAIEYFSGRSIPYTWLCDDVLQCGFQLANAMGLSQHPGVNVECKNSGPTRLLCFAQQEITGVTNLFQLGLL